MISNYLNPNVTETNASEQENGTLLSPFQRKLLLKNLEEDLRPEFQRRIRIMLLADSGHSQAEICQTLNCSNETARYWIYTARIGQAHNWHELSIGRPKRVNEEYLNRLEELVNQSPRDCGYPFTRWTAKWLGKHLAKELNIEIGERHINRLLKKMGLSTRQNTLETDKQFQSDRGVFPKGNRPGIVIGNLSYTCEPTSVDFRLFPIEKEY
ncbi:MAG: helix-turn-helix domain-containing protein [Pleurocapsa sp. SU_5_0]|nr:helix-turn-helix domain-containing protein [Pleurocapsa sp. SU_5_0]NJR45297.1 helix-turn-helix domain-containing protein [Hyellaceae cyanobacterium CSU_1_1]